ncbi:double-strand break repair helicase AddA [Plastoroseomonas arctica]|uniref:DNA 3'-5' helicase n=1 Tax=Plastoroseomonas arctica TaxID=1509237 RepID=A0AAF1JV11_9PROT|nr:double-strand break repair helicase AddA [Plastoroseomonas arctica]MBR0654292.1 double-strand break repair helicase AddA [Plastoroseomonas arctica]
MSETRTKAEADQRSASDPAISAWVGASAGSGKTRVLTDRVLRLLLDPLQKPQGILCLTFTKAAAAEMANRLARALGEWAVADDAALDARIRKLTGVAPDTAVRDHARRLFASVLDLPGGMRISTIHAFCQSLLRGFPLEAGLTPQFSVAEDRDALAMLAEAREAVLGEAGNTEAMEALAALTPPTAFAELVRALNNDRAALAAAMPAGQEDALVARLTRRLGLHADEDEAGLIAAAVAHVPEMGVTATLLANSKSESDRDRGARLRAWLALDAEARAAAWADWCGIFLTNEETAYADRNLATKGGLGVAQGEVLEAMRAEAERVAAIAERRRALRLLAATRALLTLASPVIAAYAARKSGRGMLDYDDLIDKARAVLRDPGSAWVLFKLDGGLDHVLLDEAQDSNAAQWGIARALTEEFFAGDGARERPRSVFAVGDVKQSIYGFQGADPEGFAREREFFAAAAKEAGQQFRRVPLNVSFRSTAPVLDLVDAVFAGAEAQPGVVEPGEPPLKHFADRAGQAGMVELWPPEEDPGDLPPEPWLVPEAPIATTGSADARLAVKIAETIRDWVKNGEMLPARGRPIRYGDVLVLVRKRSGAFIPTLVRTLKEMHVAVGGLDRLVLVDQIAVQDLLALADAMLLPEDDLALAAALKSPVFGLGEDDLYALAHGRTGSLASALAKHRAGASALGRAADLFAHIALRADFTGPHTLFAEVLGEHGGRARLLARLGPDAADAIDEFLGTALAHERAHPPSLQLFVQWLRQGGATVKREQDAGLDQVRIMTVHNAKGLQAPIVILPDTIGPGATDRGVRWGKDADGTDLPFWAPNATFHVPPYRDLLDAEKAAAARESHRLLYVALTRAEDRLLVAGWQGRNRPQGCWYDLIAEGFARLDGAEAMPDGRMRVAAPQTEPPRLEAASALAPSVALPDWAMRPAPAEGTEAALSPSALPGEEEGAAANPRPVGDPTGQRFRRGRLVHALLQHLPEQRPERWEATARRYLARAGAGLGAEAQAEVAAEVLALLRHPDCAAAFAPGSLAEAPLAGRVRGRLIAGQVDRIVVTPERILVVDFKTNRPPPARDQDVAPLYLRQMAAYRALLRAAYPGREVACVLIWTYGAQIMVLPSAMLDAHEP